MAKAAHCQVDDWWHDAQRHLEVVARQIESNVKLEEGLEKARKDKLEESINSDQCLATDSADSLEGPQQCDFVDEYCNKLGRMEDLARYPSDWDAATITGTHLQVKTLVLTLVCSLLLIQ